jgi:ATP-dependent DNA helicase RecG
MGELAGARQSGGVALRFANFSTDLDLLEAARRTAGSMIARDPALERPEHSAYRENVVQRYERGFELFRVG